MRIYIDNNRTSQSGFTLIEVAIVLIIVSILLGYTVALLPRQQELKQYRAVKRQMDQVVEAIIGFAQVNGRLPCPAIPNSAGGEDINGNVGCNNYGGFVPVNTLGLDGRMNTDSLLLDPWGNPYRYYVTDIDTDISGNPNVSDFTAPGEMRAVGLVDNDPGVPDGYIDLDGRYIICESAGTAANRCAGANPVFGRFQDGNGDDDDHHVDDRYGGAPFVLVSMGKNWNEVALAGDELVNGGSILTTAFTPAIPDGPAGMPYLLKDVGNRETIFVRRLDGMADDFDDVVRWVSPSVLFSRMIQADQLP
jgi:prepilin-type N-terminal cleavage/methylation domain-containing protein